MAVDRRGRSRSEPRQKAATAHGVPPVPSDTASGPTQAGEDVLVLRWPADHERVNALSAAGVPRLLIVAPGETPPEADDCLQDWIRLPCDTRDVDVRMTAILRRALRHPSRPRVDDHGRLIYRDLWTSLSPIEEKIARVLVERFGSVVSDADLARQAWGDQASSGNALRVQLTRLRRDLVPLGLEIRVVYKRGHLMQAADRGH